MAHKFSDCLGEVDVISDAENIKNLLKLPYSPKKAISMTVHRIGNTLLIDEFDLQKYLLRQADDDWEWLRKFIMDHILTSFNEKDRNFFCIKDKSRSAVQRKNLLSKFLYHSVKEAETNAPGLEQIKYTKNQSLSLAGPILPEADVEGNMPDPNSNHVFNRNIVWTFEDIRMLIGTDMPIFGGGTRPCVSLRLRDMAKPINVLTGVDYWLDNLMCNVPEVVMCYHLDGIVQKYEIIKTEDLPYLENSQFSPQLVRNVAQNILAFLKANATKAGHTYWLFKGKNDDVVKLYDLTTLCQIDDCDEKSENPFTVPVAKLLYTVARNMRNASYKIGQKKAGAIKTLLENCIKLLSKEKYPQIIASSYYILADLYVPAFIDPKAPDFVTEDEENSDSIYDEDDSASESDVADDYDRDVLIGNTNVAVKNICDTLKEFNVRNHRKTRKLPVPLIVPVEERCKVALKNICNGVDCLQYLMLNEEEISKKEEELTIQEEKRKIIFDEENLNMAKSSHPIPLPFHSRKNKSNRQTSSTTNNSNIKNSDTSNMYFKKGKQKGVPKNSTFDLPQTTLKSLVQTKIKIGNSWNVHLKLLFIEKACLVYATLAEYYYNLEFYGDCLRCIYMALKCQKVVTKYVPTAFSQRNCLLGRAGDTFFQLSKNWDHISTYIKQFESMDELHRGILMELKKDLENDNTEYIVPMNNIEGLSLQSISFYESALLCSSYDCKTEILRRLGSVRNELGLKYMNWGKEEYDKFVELSSSKKQPNDTNERLYETLTFKSYDCFIRAIEAFEKVKDELNLAFVHCNLGRFMRYRSHIHIHRERPNDIHNHKKFYNEAFSCYNKALTALGSRKPFPEIWDSMQWEYATAKFTLAQLLQDFSDANDSSPFELEKEILSLLQESLKFCKGEHCKSQSLLYQYRAGLIHYRRFCGIPENGVHSHKMLLRVVHGHQMLLGAAKFIMKIGTRLTSKKSAVGGMIAKDKVNIAHLTLANNHHKICRKFDDEGNRKRSIQLAYLHYSKTMEIMETLGESVDYLRSGGDYISLIELVAEDQSACQRVRSLSKALDIILGVAMILTTLSEEIKEYHKITPLLKLFEKRLQHILRTLTKISALNSAENPKLSELYPHFKKLYAVALKKSPEDDKKFVAYIIQKFNQIKSLKSIKI